MYVVRHGERFTLEMAHVWLDDTLRNMVQRLIQQVRKIGVKVDFLLLDREFCSLDVVRSLKRARYPFLMPVVRRGRRPKCLEKAPGALRFWAWKRSGWTKHTLINKGRRENVDVCVLLHRTLLADRRGPHFQINIEKLRPATMLLHLPRHAEVLLGVADPWSWTCPAPPFP